MTFLLGVLAVVGALAIAAAITSLRVVKEYERGVVYRFGCVITEEQSVGRIDDRCGRRITSASVRSA